MRNSSFSTSLRYLCVHTLVGTIRASDCLNPFCRPPFLVVWHTARHTPGGEFRLSPVDVSLLCCMNGSLRHRRADCLLAHDAGNRVGFRSANSVATRVDLVFRCSIAVPTTMLSTLRSIRYRIPRKTRFRCRGSRLTGRTFPVRYVKRPCRAHCQAPELPANGSVNFTVSAPTSYSTQR